MGYLLIVLMVLGETEDCKGTFLVHTDGFSLFDKVDLRDIPICSHLNIAALLR